MIILVIDNYILISGHDIHCDELGLIVHQPTLRELGLFSQIDLFMLLELFTMNKNKLPGDASKLDISNLDIFLLIKMNMKY